MNKPNIILARIDNRLVHGQVGVTWVQVIGANLIIVTDDLVAKDLVQQELMSITAKVSGVDIRFFSVQKTIDVIFNAAERQKIFIVVRTPSVLLQLLDGGVPIEHINVGNMHFSEGKKQISPKVYVNEQEQFELVTLASKVKDVYIQDVPGDNKQAI